MKLSSILYRRHPYPWYWRPYEVIKLSQLNLPPRPKLMFDVDFKPRRLSLQSFEFMGGSKLRLEQLKFLVSSLFRYERIETTFNKGDECRGYVERLIRDAIDLGDKHIPTMEMATWWLKGNEDLIHKLFKVFAPRFQNLLTSATIIYKRSSIYKDQCVLELKDNPLPPMKPFEHNFKYTLSNVLLDQLRQDFEKSLNHTEKSNVDGNVKFISKDLMDQVDNRGIPLNISDT